MGVGTHASILGEGRAGLARRRTGRTHSLSPSSRRATPPICSDLIYDRDGYGILKIGKKLGIGTSVVQRVFQGGAVSRIAVAAAIGSASRRATQLIKRNHLTLAAAMVVVTGPSADRAVTATTAKRIFRWAEAFAKPQR